MLKTTRRIQLSFFILGIALCAFRTNAADTASPQVIVIHAKKFEFVPAQVTLKKGVPVTLRLVSDDVLHSLIIPGLHIDQVMKAGETAEVAVTPAEIGDYKGVCGKYCGDGHVKMQFTIHVVGDK